MIPDDTVYNIFIEGCKAQARILKRINPSIKQYTVYDRYTKEVILDIDLTLMDSDTSEEKQSDSRLHN